MPHMKRRETNEDFQETGAGRRPRLGRPMMSHSPPAPTDSNAVGTFDVHAVQGHSKIKVRRERIRLAQRNYRSRREAEFNAVKEKAERVERALGKITKSFARFQNEVAKERVLPPRVAMALSRTALEITNLSNEARSADVDREEDGGSAEDLSVNLKGACSDHSWDQDELMEGGGNEMVDVEDGAAAQLALRASTDPPRMTEIADTVSPLSRVAAWQQLRTQSISSIPPQPKNAPLFPYTHSTNLPFALRLRLAALEKALQLLSSPTLSIGQIHPTLSLHLKWMPAQPLRVLNQNSLFRFPNLEIYGPNPHPGLPSPDLYRAVEGEREVIERKWGREVETLVFGKTRTRVETAMPGFDGDWLEASDVQEYLEDKGVLIAGADARSEIWFPTPESRVVEPSESDAIDAVSGEAQSTGPISPSQSPTAKERKGRHNRPLDPQVLIEYLALAACCIGPAPAVRKADVDRALMHAIAGF